MVYAASGPSDDAAHAGQRQRAREARPIRGWPRRSTRALDGSLAKAQAFPATFETMIAAPSGSPPHKAMEEAIAAIEAQSELLEQAAEALDVKVSFEG